MNIIDFHTHAWPGALAEKATDFVGNYYHIPMLGKGTIEDLLEKASEADVSQVVVHSTATSEKQVASINNWISNAQKEHSEIIGFGAVHFDCEDIGKVVQSIIDLGLYGIKLHPDFQQIAADDPRMLPIYEAAQGRLPILIHAGDENSIYSQPKRIANIIKSFPHLTIIAAHLGGYSRWNEAREFLFGKDIYLDTSSCYWRLSPSEMKGIILAHGEDKVLFGTDYPVTSQQEELKRFMKLNLNENQQEKILYKNAKTLLGL